MQAANRNEKTIRIKEKGNSNWCTRRAKLTEFAHEKFQTNLQTIILLSKVLQMGIQKAPYQKTYKLQVGLQEFDFKNAKDNLIGSKFLQFMTKAINIQFMTATMPNACQE